MTRAQSVREEHAPYGRKYATVVNMPAALLDVGVRYMKQLRRRAREVSQALQKAKVPHAVIGRLAVAAHVARVDETAQRNTQDLDILLQRMDLDAAKAALSRIGYRYRRVMKVDAFMPAGRGHKFADGVHVVWSGEKVRQDYIRPAPDLATDSTYKSRDGVEYLGLVELLTMKLTSFRLKDKVHVQDLLAQKLITKKIESALAPEIRARLEQVKEDTAREQL